MNTALATAEEVYSLSDKATRVLCRMESGELAEAISYHALCAAIQVGHKILINTTAVDLNLGTGGVHFVVANLDVPDLYQDVVGHIIKLRYSPLQTQVLAAEEPESPYHDRLTDADTLGGTPVICCELLSQVPAVLAGCLYRAKDVRVALVVTDEAALPVPFSRLINDLQSRNLLHAVISSGQCFGGDLEAVNVYSALLVAHHVASADLIITSPGPGTVGTNTKWGFGGVAQGQAVNAAASLEGLPIAVVRASRTDARTRHSGISHHTSTVFQRVILTSFWAAWPYGSTNELSAQWKSLLDGTSSRCRGYVMRGTREALDAFETEWTEWQSMGRDRLDDPFFFECAAAAGLLADQVREERQDHCV